MPSGLLRKNARSMALLALVWAIVIGALVGFLAQSQAGSRDELNQRFEARAVIASRFVSTYVGDLIDRQRGLARRRLSGARVGEGAFRQASADSGYEAALLLDAKGRVLQVLPAKSALIGTKVVKQYPHLATALTGRVGISPVVQSAARGIPIVAFAVPFQTASGRRVYSGGHDVAKSPLGAYLRNAIPIAGTRLYLVDPAGQVVAKNGLTTRPEKLSTIEGELTRAAEAGANGSYESNDGRQRFSTQAVAGTSWRIVAAVPEARLQTSFTGPGRYLPWLAVLGFALAGLAAGFLLLRLLATRERLLAGRTKLAAALATLQERETMLGGVIENSTSLIHVKHLDGRYLLYNQPFADAFNLDERGRAEGKTGMEVLLGRDDTWLDPELAITWRANDALAIQGPQFIEEWSDHPSRGRLTYDSAKFPLHDGEGNVYATCGVSLDVSERLQAIASLREAEELFRGAFEGAPVGMGLVERDGRWGRVNQALCDFTGYSRAELLTMSFKDITHPEDVDDDLRAMDQLLTGEIHGYQREKRYLHADGRAIWASVSVSLVRDSSGEPLHFIGQIQDISERKQAQRDLALARDQAIEASRVKSEFLATMSHEIRTPLNGVIGMTELLLSTDLTSTQAEFARNAATSGEALLDVVNDVLDFSKIEAGKLELEVHEFDLRESAEDTCKMLAAQAHDKGVEMTVWIDDDVPEIVAGDRGRLRQVLTNVLSNAVKFTSAGEVGVRIRADRRGEESTLIHFEVTDTGIGIAAAEVERLFESFSQADSSTTRRYGGTGLGLAISRRLVGLMGGEISAVSRQGAGSTFTFTVSLQTPARPRSSRRPRIAIPDTLRVLAVDDNPTSRSIMHAYLTNRGVTCEQASSGAEAITVLRAAAEPFDVVVADVDMPDGDGVELARAIGADPSLSDTPVILLTCTQEQRQAAQLAGSERLLSKPLRRAHLFEALADAVSGDPQGEIAAPATVAAFAASSSRPLLVVEDNAVNQLVIKTMLASRGFMVEIANNGLEALDRHAGDSDFAAVFMDCQMPELDGYGATAQIRIREDGGRHLPIIAMTANTMKGDRERCLESGMDDYLPKPLRPHQLDAVLERWVGGRSDGFVAASTSRTPIGIEAPGVDAPV